MQTRSTSTSPVLAFVVALLFAAGSARAQSTPAAPEAAAVTKADAVPSQPVAAAAPSADDDDAETPEEVEEAKAAQASWKSCGAPSSGPAFSPTIRARATPSPSGLAR